jgi:hypothetical protein
VEICSYSSSLLKNKYSDRGCKIPYAVMNFMKYKLLIQKFRSFPMLLVTWRLYSDIRNGANDAYLSEQSTPLLASEESRKRRTRPVSSQLI